MPDGAALPPAGTPVLTVTGLHAAYGPVAVLHGLDFVVHQGEIVVLLGANGAGKTTTLRALCGMVDTKGSVRLRGLRADRRRPPRRSCATASPTCPRAAARSPSCRSRTTSRSAPTCARTRPRSARTSTTGSTVFPRLGERRSQQAGSLSGGEQQMLAVARALMMRPRLLLLDEPSLGLAPIITQDLFQRLADLNKELDTTMFVVEQNANLALSIAERAYVLEAGRDRAVRSGRRAPPRRRRPQGVPGVLMLPRRHSLHQRELLQLDAHRRAAGERADERRRSTPSWPSPW